MGFWVKFLNRLGFSRAISQDDVPTIVSIVDKIAHNAGRLNGGFVSISDQANSASRFGVISREAFRNSEINLKNFLTSEEIRAAKRVGLNSDLLTLAVHAFSCQIVTFAESYKTSCEKVSTDVGDAAIKRLCEIDDTLSSYILFRVANAATIIFNVRGCLPDFDREYRLDNARSKRAREELQKRGFRDERWRISINPLNVIVK